jgi:hypothetical protein
MATLKDAPKNLFPRVSRTLTRRYEELASNGKLDRVHPLELLLVRRTVELCERCIGSDVNALEKWKWPTGSPVHGLPPLSLKQYLTAPLEQALGDDLQLQILYIAGRILYAEVYREIAQKAGVDPNDANQMYAMAENLLTDVEEKLISAGQLKVVDNQILATMFQMARALKSQLHQASPESPNNRAGAALVKALQLHESIERHHNFLEPLDPTDPPPYFDTDWWLER